MCLPHLSRTPACQADRRAWAENRWGLTTLLPNTFPLTNGAGSVTAPDDWSRDGAPGLLSTTQHHLGGGGGGQGLIWTPGPTVSYFTRTSQLGWLIYGCRGEGRGLGPPTPPPRPSPLCDIPSGCCSFTGPWTVTRSSLRMLRRVAAFCRPLRPVLLLVSFPRSQSPVVGVLGLC